MPGLAIFGGTFDPIHNAHIQLARTAAERFDLEKVLFIPSARPPHRREGPFASYEDRFQMVSLACAASPTLFVPSRLEEGPEISYSIATIEQVSRILTGRPLYFLIGADAFADIQTWHRSLDVIDAVSFIVVSRPGAEYQIPPGARTERLEEIQLPISSSEIRKKFAEGEPVIDVPDAVLAYILRRGLYGSHEHSQEL